MTTVPAAPSATASGTAVAAHAVRGRPGWLPIWSVDALCRAIRATLVIPGLFALTDQVLGNVEMATYAAFGGFATLVLARFGGTRRDKVVAHFGLAVTGTALIVVGTLASSSTALAALVTVAVAFVVLFAGVLGPNTAAAATGALLAFVLPVVSKAGMGTVPDRLAGWWMVSVVGTAAVLVIAPRAGEDRLHQTAGALASSLADEVDATLSSTHDRSMRERSTDAKEALRAAFTSTPYRPTGLAVPDRALANLVELLEWSCALVGEVVVALPQISEASSEDIDLLEASRGLLKAIAGLLHGEAVTPDLDAVEHLLSSAAARAHDKTIDTDADAESAHLTFHARNLAVAARAAATDCLIASRKADESTVTLARLRWYGDPETPPHSARIDLLLNAGGVAARHANLRSIWFINSLRGALALAAAVAVADVTNVQHGFWVVLGTLSVLRTNAASTGASAARAIAGTAVGFLLGGALVIAIGSDNAALWIALPITVFVAAYAPGTAPFAVGQAAFTLLVAVLFNLLVPVGWKVGVVRIEDVALGCGVSVLVGLLFWPRGAAGVVGDDLADTFLAGSSYLAEAVDWVLGRSPMQPRGGVASVTASLRLDDALRGLLTEQGSKRVAKEQLWSLVGSSMRLRLTAHALAGAHPTACGLGTVEDTLVSWAGGLTGWYAQLADCLEGTVVADKTRLQSALPAIPTEFTTPLPGTPVCALWVGEHLRDLRTQLTDIVGPAVEVSSMRHRPWWR